MVDENGRDAASGTAAPARLEVRGVSKRFGAVRAIRNADMVVAPGSVHALVGENGAGKSTLIKIVSGAEASDTGTLSIDGTVRPLASTAEAMAAGIATVYQEPQLFAELTVAENVFTGREITRRGRVDWAAQGAAVVDLLALIGLPASYAGRTVGDLSIAEQQQVSIAKALGGQARVLILDEPSAILTDSEIEVLFTVVRRLTASGVSIVYISHRLDELFRIADTVTVMRDGQTVGTYPLEELSVRGVVELMVGGALDEAPPDRPAPQGEPHLVLEGLSATGFHDVDLAVAQGEIVALYGLVGCGAQEIAECVYGIRSPTTGRVLLGGREVRITSPRDAERHGVALLPANRKAQGLFSFQSIAFNISAGHLRLLSRGRLWVDRARERSVAKDMVARLSVRTPDERAPVASLSGGNAQKVVLARQLVERPGLLLLAEPTQGVDVGAKEEIHRIVTALADQGTAVLVVTSDLPEAIRIADRLVVVRAGQATAEFGRGASQVDVLAAAAGGGDNAGGAPADAERVAS